MFAYSPEANNSPARSVPSRRKPSLTGMPLLATLPVAQRICMRFMFWFRRPIGIGGGHNRS